MSPEDFLELPLPRHLSEYGVDIRFGHDKRERASKRLGLHGRSRCFPGLVELSLVESEVLVSLHFTGTRCFSSSNQFSVTLICSGWILPGSPWDLGTITTKYLPSGVMS